MPEKVLILPDTHFPDHSPKVFKAVLKAIELVRPDEIIHIGDLMDYHQPSRWTKGTRAEFEGDIITESEQCVRRILEPLREVFDGPIGIHEGNHDARPRLYMEKYAPALANNDLFNFESLLRFSDLGISLLPDFHEVAPGWLTTHGHLGGIRLNQNAGITALNAAKKIGKSIVMGHTHRSGIASFTTGVEGETSTITGVEVGHIVDQKKVTYLKQGTGNWQQGLALLEIDGKNVTPHLIPVSAGRIIYENEVIKA